MEKLAAMSIVLLLASFAWAGPTAHVGREMTKGATEQVKKEAQKIDLKKGAKDVSGGVIDGLSEHRGAVNRAARDVGREIAQGFFSELRSELGSDGKGPLATSLAAAGEVGTRRMVHGAAEEISGWLPACQGNDRAACMDALVQRYAYQSSRAAARGAGDGASPWPTVVVAGGGFLGGLICSAVIALLLGQRRTRRELSAFRPRTA
jgi:hypothetical protein